MSGPVNKLEKIVPAELTKTGEVLEGVILSSDRAKDKKPKRLDRSAWDDALAEHVATMADGDTVTVVVTFNLADGKRTARLAGVAPLATVTKDRDRTALLAKAGGFVNPYTFVPTLPRSDQHGTRLAGTDLDDAPPPSHAHHADGQWSGTLSLTLTTVTPLLLPVPAATPSQDGVRTFDVRVDPHGRPLIHGASLKGALRSAYETITASRYGIFFEHHERLAYRVNAGAALNLTPARVYLREDGTAAFRLCRGDADWTQSSTRGNEVQYAAWVPTYKVSPVRRLGDLARGPLTQHHGSPVHARLVLHQYRKGKTQFQVWRATHLARTAAEITGSLPPDPAAGRNSAHTLTPVTGVAPRFVRGWLSATGYSIGRKHDERLFVETDGVEVPLAAEHVSYWQSVLRAYDVAQGYNDPNATYSRGTSTARGGVVRSMHVPSNPELRTLPPGTLVYVKYDEQRNEVTEVHPVMIGRLPFDAAPGDLLHESLRPARHRDELSPADRLFGWVPPGRADDGTDTNDGASGYRGRLRVRSITCTTEDWRPSSFPSDGVTLAPLSSPKPTQFRFYASPDPSVGMPVRRKAAKADGYTTGGGLRGRKMYRWREEAPDHWEPTKSQDKDSQAPGYLALEDHYQHATQLVCHHGWVRPEVTFQADLFLDGVPDAELGALLWLLTRGKDAPLRLGAGKPYGFGVVTARLDPERTRLWDAAGVRAGWRGLTRPDPVGAHRLTELADRFDATARGNEVLREATESYLEAVKPVTEPVHYPRMTPQPQAENYQWFVANDRVAGGETVEGWPLPHVRDSDQRLPYLGSGRDERPQGSRGAGASPERRVPPPRPASGQERRPQPRPGAGAGNGNGTNQRAAGRQDPGGKDNRTRR
ncbi:TIGR03986 family type III CRISPR-associated RAMP protein [Micromonospora rosaria]|uniref:TIGR03986 family type III CRISPR-associated RAMP protein n=1 Tax=Micromonospora rosaria TaxID=47874 RepID=UPI00083238B5|nr:TIGR03986 family CRISPR-associated RAMP protein [Micromonospora rosaria]